MTVLELLALVAGHPADAEVLVFDSEAGDYHPLHSSDLEFKEKSDHDNS